MKKRNLIVIGLSAIFVLAAGAAFAFPGGPGGKGGMRGFMNPERMLKMLTWKVDDACDEIEATDAQRALAHDVKQRLFEQGKAIHEDQRGTRADLVDAWLLDSPDGEAMRALVDAKIERMRAFAYSAIDASLEIHAALTPEQRQKLTEILPMMGPGRGFGPRPGGPTGRGGCGMGRFQQ